MRTNPPADARLPKEEGAELILVATTEEERRFVERYGSG